MHGVPMRPRCSFTRLGNRDAATQIISMVCVCNRDAVATMSAVRPKRTDYKPPPSVSILICAKVAQCLKLHGYSIGDYRYGFLRVETNDASLFQESLQRCQVREPSYIGNLWLMVSSPNLWCGR